MSIASVDKDSFVTSTSLKFKRQKTVMSNGRKVTLVKSQKCFEVYGYLPGTIATLSNGCRTLYVFGLNFIVDSSSNDKFGPLRESLD